MSSADSPVTVGEILADGEDAVRQFLHVKVHMPVSQIDELMRVAHYGDELIVDSDGEYGLCLGAKPEPGGEERWSVIRRMWGDGSDEDRAALVKAGYCPECCTSLVDAGDEDPADAAGYCGTCGAVVFADGSADFG